MSQIVQLSSRKQIKHISRAASVTYKPEQIDLFTTEAHLAWDVHFWPEDMDILDSRIAAYSFDQLRRCHGIWPQLFYVDLQVGLANSFLPRSKTQTRQSSITGTYTYKSFLVALVGQTLRLADASVSGEGDDVEYCTYLQCHSFNR